jgi:hypothetical protein
MPESPDITFVFDPGMIEAARLVPYADSLRRAAAGLTAEVSVAASAAQLGGQEADSLVQLAGLDYVSLTIHDAPVADTAAALNTAVAAARSDLVLVIEDGSGLVPVAVPDAVARLGSDLWDWLGVAGVGAEGAYREREWHEDTILLCRREDFLRLRGYDEHGAGARRSADLRVRFARAGLGGGILGPTATVGDVLTPLRSSGSAEALEHIENDPSIYRNLTAWSVPTRLRPVLVSVAIATRNRAPYLRESIDSILNQTFQEFEVIVVDDGSEDETRKTIEEIADPRVRYFYQEATGISSARNLAADRSLGFFTAVHDDDDLMLPDRLEVSLAVLTADYDASYGSWVNFDDDTGAMVSHVIRDEFNADLVAFNGQGPGHATWLLPTGFVQRARYDETYSASVDHNLATRLAWQGCRWVHSERVAFLRRIHATQVSITDGGGQKIGHVLTRLANEFSASSGGRAAMRQAGSKHVNPVVPGVKQPEVTFAAYLPDRLVKRTAIFHGNVSNRLMKVGSYAKIGAILTDREIRTSRSRAEVGHLNGVVWDDMVRLRQHGEFGYTLSARIVDPSLPDHQPGDEPRAEEIFRKRIDHVLASLPKKNNPVWFIATSDLDAGERAVFGASSTQCRVVAVDDSARYTAELYGFSRAADVPNRDPRLLGLIAAGRITLVTPFARTSAEAAAAAALVMKGL